MPLRRIADYEASIRQCRTLARQVRDPEQKRALEEIIQAWEALIEQQRERLERKTG